MTVSARPANNLPAAAGIRVDGDGRRRPPRGKPGARRHLPVRRRGSRHRLAPPRPAPGRVRVRGRGRGRDRRRALPAPARNRPCGSRPASSTAPRCGGSARSRCSSRPSMVPGAHDRARVLAAAPVIREMIVYAARWPISRPTSDPVADAFFEALARLVPEWLDRRVAAVPPDQHRPRGRRRHRLHERAPRHGAGAGRVPRDRRVGADAPAPVPRRDRHDLEPLSRPEPAAAGDGDAGRARTPPSSTSRPRSASTVSARSRGPSPGRAGETPSAYRRRVG